MSLPLKQGEVARAARRKGFKPHGQLPFIFRSTRCRRRYSFVTKRVPRKVSLFRRSDPAARGLRPLDPTNKDENNEIHPKVYDRTDFGTDFIIFD